MPMSDLILANVAVRIGLVPSYLESKQIYPKLELNYICFLFFFSGKKPGDFFGGDLEIL